MDRGWAPDQEKQGKSPRIPENADSRRMLPYSFRDDSASGVVKADVLDAKQHQGKFGEDYVRVLASAAGLIVLKEDIDVDGVDLGFRLHGRYQNSRFPTIEAQVKTCSAPKTSAGNLVFRGLNESQFNMLAGPDFTVPRFLFVVCVPTVSEHYALCLTEGVMLRYLGYFVSLHTEKPIVDPDTGRNRTVRVPTANVLTTTTLRRLTETQAIW